MEFLHILHTPDGSIVLLQVFASAFLAILFLQSGLDKVTGRRGNLDWLTGHFAKSPLSGMVPALLAIITLFELLAGALSAVGCVSILLGRGSSVAFFGAAVSAISITALFFGQRMAKDYAGAGALVPYFLLCLCALYLLAR